mmetsp:Transcript_87459/g.234213  ORF Transcript_87459/g.234213 Transcript_87459/m.234213 type:complete len:293 (+) Transcript_87459:497-1375(+)
MLITGGGDGNNVLFSVKSQSRNVALMITNRSGGSAASPGRRASHRSRRSSATRDNIPIRMSQFTLRSCASSKTIAVYLRHRKSLWSSRSRIPSVINLILVFSVHLFLSYRTWYPTKSSSPISSPTRAATEIAATRRGCVTPIRYPRPSSPLSSMLRQNPDSYKNWGTWVDFPHPVSPQTIDTSLCIILSTISCSIITAGSPRRWVSIAADRVTCTTFKLGPAFLGSGAAASPGGPASASVGGGAPCSAAAGASALEIGASLAADSAGVGSVGALSWAGVASSPCPVASVSSA